MKIKGFRTIAALIAVVFGLSATAFGQSSYQYLISDQNEVQQDKVAPMPEATANQVDQAVVDNVNQVLDDSSFLNFGGWVQSGYHSYNNGPALFNNRDSKFNLHQAYIFAEKKANPNNGLGLGFRADYVYGIDAQNTQAFFGPASSWDNTWDNGAFGHAIPQLYGEMAMGDLNVKVGKFYTILGYESVMAPQNFFYSHSFTMNLSEPFTHTGVLGSFDMGDVTFYGGWTLGWDSGFDSSVSKGSNFIGGASLSFGDAGSITNNITYGRLGAGSTRGGFSQSLVADLNLTQRLKVVLQSDYVYNNDVNESHGVNTYVIYQLTDQIGIGSRLEWWNNNTTGAPLGTSDVYGMTHGLNIKVADNLIVRPEARWNSDADGLLIPAADNNRYGFGVDAIWTF